MNKELLTVKFCYWDKPRWERDSGSKEKTITLGIFDTFKEATKAGDEVLKILSEQFVIGPNDYFTNNSLLGFPIRSVSNYFRSNRGIRFYVEITTLVFEDLLDVVKEVFEAGDRYNDFKKKREEEEE